MKKFYFIALILIFIFAAAFIAYGIHLNQSGEKQIALRMAERTVPLQGTLAKHRNIFPVFELDTINLTSEEISDAVALIDGRITAANVQKNSNVHYGQTLFQIVNEDIPVKLQAAEAAIARAEAQLLQATNSFARYQRLKDKNATSLEKYDEAKLSFEAAQATLKEARAQRAQLVIQSDRQNVLSPIDGKILIQYKQVGSFVTAGTPICLIGNFSRLSFSLTMNDSSASSLAAGDTFSLNLNDTNITKAYDTDFAPGNRGNNQAFPCTITEILPDKSQSAAMRKVLFQVDNSAGILEQQSYNSVQIVSKKPVYALTVPIRSVYNGQVFIVENSTLIRRAVTTGTKNNNFVEITSGLNEGDIVVTSAINDLTEGLKVSVTLVNPEE